MENDRTWAQLSLEGELGDLAFGLKNKHEKVEQEFSGSDFSSTTNEVFEIKHTISV